MIATLYYVHDPMCSWCWAFRPTLTALKAALPDDLPVHPLLGGLAPDSDTPMPEEMRQYLQNTWRKIQAVVPGTEFNYDFWHNNVPRRSTYPACRAVIAATQQDPSMADAMTHAIQRAYYLEATNPSDDANLVAIARHLGLDTDRFSHDLNAPATHEQLLANITEHRALGAQGFPSLIIASEAGNTLIPIDYVDAAPMLTAIHEAT